MEEIQKERKTELVIEREREKDRQKDRQTDRHTHAHIRTNKSVLDKINFFTRRGHPFSSPQ